MKKIITICAAILMTASVFAQAPQKMSYQAVIRNSNDQLVANQTVGMQISILQGSASGTIVYSEIQTPTTNINGLVSLEIGTGTTSDDFSSIDWANGPYFIETKTAVVPPLTTYTITGTSQLLSVPYALHAKTADNGITTAQADAIVANTLKVGITQAQADAIVANTAKVGITNEQADAIVANTAKVGITTEQADAIVANTAKVGITTEQADAIVANTAKVGITTEQADAIVANTLKVGITQSQADAIVANTAKVGITTEQADAIVANTLKVGITQAQADAIVANTAKVGITTEQADAIVANTLKVGITQAQADAIVANTAKVGITTEQADAIVANTLKVGITQVQADAIVANTAKVGITTEQADAIVANTAKVGISTEQATKLAGIEAEAQKNVQADWNATSGDAQILNKPTIPAAADGSETKVTAGTNVTVTGSGTTASPYVINASNGGGGGTRYLGEEYLGGIIFYLYTDATGTQKGLVVSKTETTTQWQSATSTTGATRTEDGEYNTANMINSPAKNWVENLGVDWYLPSVDELSFLWQNRFHVNKTSRAIGSTLLNIVPYWSSTEGSASDVYVFDFYSGYPYYSDKTWDFKVRAVRSF